jgi:hypothetical protein
VRSEAFTTLVESLVCVFAYQGVWNWPAALGAEGDEGLNSTGGQPEIYSHIKSLIDFLFIGPSASSVSFLSRPSSVTGRR